MSPRFVVTGTDTGIGKTVFAAALCQALDADYWKPVQSGLEEETDSETIARLAGLDPARVHPERYRLAMPASPHRAAAAEGVAIEAAALTPPDTRNPLVIEGAGGVLVPLTPDLLYADIFARWAFPVILCARTALGTINHSLLSIEALRARGIPILGVAFIGDADEENEAIIARIGNVRRLGRLARIPQLDRAALARAFDAGFDKADFRAPA
jgi:dethiobiotin synthetase